MKDVVDDVRRWMDAGSRVAVATVVGVKRSAPRPPGAKMAVNDAGEVSGAVSGGCGEGAGIDAAARGRAGRGSRRVRVVGHAVAVGHGPAGLGVAGVARAVAGEEGQPICARESEQSVRPSQRDVELPGEDHLMWSEPDEIIDVIEEFVTGTVAAPPVDRVLTTVLFTDIVDSTRRAAELGDRGLSRELDVTQEAAWSAVLDEVIATRGRLDDPGDQPLLRLYEPAYALPMVGRAAELALVREKLAQVKATFRDEVKEARISRFDPASRPIYTLAITSPDGSRTCSSPRPRIATSSLLPVWVIEPCSVIR